MTASLAPYKDMDLDHLLHVDKELDAEICLLPATIKTLLDAVK